MPGRLRERADPRVDDDYYEDMDYDSTVKLIEALKRGERPAPGSGSGQPDQRACRRAADTDGAED